MTQFSEQSLFHQKISNRSQTCSTSWSPAREPLSRTLKIQLISGSTTPKLFRPSLQVWDPIGFKLCCLPRVVMRNLQRSMFSNRYRSGKISMSKVSCPARSTSLPEKITSISSLISTICHLLVPDETFSTTPTKSFRTTPIASRTCRSSGAQPYRKRGFTP